jgi:hypothetical protein
VDDIVFGEEGGKECVSVSMSKIGRVLRMKTGSKELVDYESYAGQPDWMGLRTGLAARKWLDGGSYVPDVVGVHHERMERDARKDEDTAGSDNNKGTTRGHGRGGMEYVCGRRGATKCTRREVMTR